MTRQILLSGAEVIMMESAGTLLFSAIRAGDERNPPVKPRSRHLDNTLAAEVADRCYEHALAHAAASESADWLVFREGFEPWWREMLGQAADRVLPGLRTDIAGSAADGPGSR